MIKLVWFHGLFLMILQILMVQGSIQLRKHATVHFLNDTVYVLGGTTDRGISLPSLSFQFDKTILSLHSPSIFSELEVYGHTSHLDRINNSIVSVYGISSNKSMESSLLEIPFEHHRQTIRHNSQPSPKPRFQHTSILLNQTDIYLIGGKSLETKHLLWHYNFFKQAWRSMDVSSDLTSISGHISFTYGRWIISCFGLQNNKLSNQCFSVDTIDGSFEPIQSDRSWPIARQLTTVAPLGDNKYIVFGGEVDDGTVLDDVWQLEIHDMAYMTWTQLHNLSGIYKRSGHANTDILDSNMVLYYGGQDKPLSFATEAIYLDKIKLKWVQPPTFNSYSTMSAMAPDPSGPQTQYGVQLSQASIIGIIIAALVVAAGLIVLVIWYFKKKYRHKETLKSRIGRFSRSSQRRMSTAEKNSKNKRMSVPRLDVIQESDDLESSEDQLMELPPVVVNNHYKSRLSMLSLGTEFRFSPSEFFRSSPVPNGSVESLIASKAYASPRLKQLSLHLFSSNFHPNTNQQPHVGRHQVQPDPSHQVPATPTTPRTPRTPQTPVGRFISRQNQSRGSLGSQSVASIQWVGFNDSMDYKCSDKEWHNDSAPSVQLAVTNGMTPKTPTFPDQVK